MGLGQWLRIEPFNGPRVEKLKIEVITIEMG